MWQITKYQHTKATNKALYSTRTNALSRFYEYWREEASEWYKTEFTPTILEEWKQSSTFKLSDILYEPWGWRLLKLENNMSQLWTVREQGRVVLEHSDRTTAIIQLSKIHYIPAEDVAEWINNPNKNYLILDDVTYTIEKTSTYEIQLRRIKNQLTEAINICTEMEKEL